MQGVSPGYSIIMFAPAISGKSIAENNRPPFFLAANRLNTPANRREFLQGKAALQAARDLATNLGNSRAGQGGTKAVEWHDPQATGYLVRYSRTAMACEWEVLLNYHEQALGTPPAMAALDLVEELEAQLTVYRDTSELSSLNRLAATQPIEVEQRLFHLLKLAAEIWRETEGAYDITSGPLTKIWGFYQRQGRLPGDEEIASALANVGMQFISLNSAAHTVQFSKPKLELNLGSIGKGYALDRCAELLDSAGVPNYLLHGGNSSVLGRGGTGSDTCWWIGIRDPLLSERRIFEIAVRNRAVGTSGAAVQFFIHRGVRYGHIIDPRSGWPARGLLSVTVVAPTAAIADALATAFYVLGPAGTHAYLAKHPEISALLFTAGQKSGTWEIEAVNFAEDDLRRMSDHG
jgi:thiamine biosynthesis lipoprotein